MPQHLCHGGRRRWQAESFPGRALGPAGIGGAGLPPPHWRAVDTTCCRAHASVTSARPR